MSKTIDDKTVKVLIRKVFKLINNKVDTSAQEIIKELGIPDEFTYTIIPDPSIIAKSELFKLFNNVSSIDPPKIVEKLNTPMEKLFYTVLWKNNMLNRLNPLIEGVFSVPNEKRISNGIIFYQLGKFISNEDEPIIDQHVLRAYNLHQLFSSSNKNPSNEAIKKARSLEKFDSKSSKLVSDYIKWIKGISKNAEDKRGLQRKIDFILFAVGKYVKEK